MHTILVQKIIGNRSASGIKMGYANIKTDTRKVLNEPGLGKILNK